MDIQTKKVVNNDYFNLTRYWEVEWKEFHKPGAPDLYPENLREQIDELNDILFHDVNNGEMLKDYPNLWGYARDLYSSRALEKQQILMRLRSTIISILIFWEEKPAIGLTYFWLSIFCITTIPLGIV